MDQDQCFARAVRQANSKLLTNAKSFDIDVTVGGKTFPCHKLILTSWSGYFETLIQGDWKDSQGPVNMEEDEKVSEESFEVLRDWMYKGLLNLSVDNVFDVLACAHYLQIINALDHCISYIEEMYKNKQFQVHDMMKMVALAERYGLLRLQGITFKYMLQNFEAISSTADFLDHMTMDMLLKLLKREDLVCSTEDKIFNVAMSWLKHKEERFKFVGDIIVCLRLGMVSIPSIVDGIDFMLASHIKTPETFNLVQAATARESDARKMTYLMENHPNMFNPRQTPGPITTEDSKDAKDGSTKTEDLTDNERREWATFSLTIYNIRMLEDTVKSPACYIRNLQWKIVAKPKYTVSGKSLGFYLECNANSKSRGWSCYAISELRILSNKLGVEHFVRDIEHKFTRWEVDWGFANFIAWDELLDKNRGFLCKDGSITLQVHVTAEEPKGVN